MDEPTDILEFVERNLQALQACEVLEEIEILTCPAIDVELDIASPMQQFAGLAQLARRQRLAELQDRAFRLERTKGIKSSPLVRKDATGVADALDWLDAGHGSCPGFSGRLAKLGGNW